MDESVKTRKRKEPPPPPLRRQKKEAEEEWEVGDERVPGTPQGS